MPGQSTDHLQVHPRRVALAPVTIRGARATTRAGNRSTVDDVLPDLGRGPPRRAPSSGGPQRPKGVNRDYSRDDGLVNPCGCRPATPEEIVPQRQKGDLDAAEQPQGTRPCCRISFRNRQRGSVHTNSSGLVTVKACGGVHSSSLSFF